MIHDYSYWLCFNRTFYNSLLIFSLKHGIFCYILADMNATVSSARVTSRTYYKLAGLGIGEMIRLSSFLLSGTCLFCNTVLWVRDSNRTCRSHSVPQHCWSAFYWFFICSNREFSVGFRNAETKGCIERVLIRNAWFLTEILWAGFFALGLGFTILTKQDLFH